MGEWNVTRGGAWVLMGLVAACASEWTPTAPGTPGVVRPPRVEGPPVAIDANDVVIAPEAPPALFGGTLTPDAAGRTALASEPARDRLHLVDLGALGEGAPLLSRDLEAGAAPWRSVAVDDGWIVSLRGGAILRVGTDLEERWRTPLSEARGVAIDGEQVWAATASGALVALDLESGVERTRYPLPRDLRDVVVGDDGALFVSRFRAAEVLRVRDGVVEQTFRPETLAGFETRVAWRLTMTTDQRLVLLAQAHGVGLVEDRPEPARPGEPSRGGYAGAAGGHGDGVSETGAVTPMLLMFTKELERAVPIRLPKASLTVDVATFGEGAELRLAVAVAGEHHALVSSPFGQLATLTRGAIEERPDGSAAYGARGLVSAVAFDGRGQVIVQSAGDSRVFDVGGLGTTLSAAPLYDAGRTFFHERQEGTGLACASCHPEGSDDGHVWNFAVSGPRRTQTLAGGVTQRAPFHWDGSIATMESILHTNMALMGGEATDAQREAATRFMDALPAETAGTEALSEGAIARGRAHFDAQGCASCHGGDRLTDDALHRLRGDVMGTPSLRGAGLRDRLFHDGCVATLEDLGRDARCRDGVHDLEGMGEDARGDLVAFVATR
ncbi:MAG: PQQ-binding-like beta-propeller repeat protein [Myxococcota bacterium]